MNMNNAEYDRILNKITKGNESLTKKAIYEQYEEWVKNLRNYPSVVLYSASNEVFWSNVSQETIEEMIKISQHIKSIDPTRIVDNQGLQNFKNNLSSPILDDRFDVVNLHYPHRDLIIDWQKKYKKPLVLGEVMSWKAFGILVHGHIDIEKWDIAIVEQANWIRENIPFYIDMEISGIMPFSSMWMVFNGKNPKYPGPWSDLIKFSRDRDTDPLLPGGFVDIPWPANSGALIKPNKMSIGGPGGEQGAINWFDPNRVEFTPSVCYEALKENFRPMPFPKEVNLSPQVILHLFNNEPKASLREKELSDINVILKPAEGQCTNSIGVKTDKEGKAWFILPEKGKYITEVEGYKTNPSSIEVNYRKLDLKPGYNIPIVTINCE
jgi:hypothetical protein